jgi:hypothetical protein
MDWPSAFSVRMAGPDVLADHRGKPFGRLVEDEQARIGHQRPADGQHLLLAARERAGRIGRAARQPREQGEDAR